METPMQPPQVPGQVPQTAVPAAPIQTTSAAPLPHVMPAPLPYAPQQSVPFTVQAVQPPVTAPIPSPVYQPPDVVTLQPPPPDPAPMPNLPEPNVPATGYGQDVPLMEVPGSLQQLAGPGVPMTIGDPSLMAKEALGPQVMSQELMAPKGIDVFKDELIGSIRIITIKSDTVDRATGIDARAIAYQQRLRQGWTNAGIEYLDVYAGDENGEMLQRRDETVYAYYSRWKLVPGL